MKVLLIAFALLLSQGRAAPGGHVSDLGDALEDSSRPQLNEAQYSRLIGIRLILSDQNHLSMLRNGMEYFHQDLSTQERAEELLQLFRTTMDELRMAHEEASATKKFDMLFNSITSAERLLWATGALWTSAAHRPSAKTSLQFANFLIAQLLFRTVFHEYSNFSNALRVRALMALGELILASDAAGRAAIHQRLGQISSVVMNRQVSAEFSNLAELEKLRIGDTDYVTFLDRTQRNLFSMLLFLSSPEEKITERIERALKKFTFEPNSTQIKVGEGPNQSELSTVLGSVEFLRLLAHARGKSLDDIPHPQLARALSPLMQDQKGPLLEAFPAVVSAHFQELSRRFKHAPYWDANMISAHDNSQANRWQYIFSTDRMPDSSRVGGVSLSHINHGDDARQFSNLLPSQKGTWQAFHYMRYRPNVLQRVRGWFSRR